MEGIGNKVGRFDIKNALLYMASELTDNVRDHAHTTFGALAYFSDAGGVALAIADTGISIPAAYREAGIILADDCEALQQALKGVSTKKGETGRGKGLDSVGRLATQALQGELVMLSGNALLTHTLRGATCAAASLYWQGTIVVVVGRIPKQSIDLYQYVG